MRADLAGGTLDLWPIYLFFPGACTVNVAISLTASCEIATLDDESIEIALLDSDYEQRYDTISDVTADAKVGLIARALEHFKLTGIRIETRSDAPRGSGLGGSSALAIAVVRALSEVSGNPIDGYDLIRLVRDLETRLLGVPAGIQDYFPPVYGGLASIRLEPGNVHRHPIRLPVEDLAQHMIIHYSGVAHFSGSNNWEIYKRLVDGDEAVRDGLGRIAASAMAMESALASGRLDVAGAVLAEEWNHRKELFRGVSTPELERVVKVAKRAGAWGTKVCGAGGGGCSIVLVEPRRRAEVVAALRKLPGQILKVAPVAWGLLVETPDQQSLYPAFTRPTPSTEHEPPEQFFLTPGQLVPFLLASATVHFDEQKSATRYSFQRNIVAAIDCDTGRIDWPGLRRIDPDELTLSPVPIDETKPDSRLVESSGTIANDCRDQFVQLLLDNESLPIFRNPDFDLYSRPDESLESFQERCREIAGRLRNDGLESLVATYRRRLDQVRQQFEKLLLEEANAASDDLQEPDDSVIPWGRVLNDITSGKAPNHDSPRNAIESDCFEKIGELRKAWERDRATIDDEIEARAANTEKIILSPRERDLEIGRYFVVWAESIGAFEAH